MKTIEDKKNTLIKYMDYLTDEQVNFIYNLTNLNGASKRDLLTLAGITKDEQSKMDSATPIDYVNKVKDIFPSIENANLMYNYNDNVFGEMININDLIVNKILNLTK